MEKREQNEVATQSKAYLEVYNNHPELRGRIFAINNNSENSIKGALNKAMGVYSGVSDMCFILSGGRVAWIEWKTEFGTQSKQQTDWQSLIESCEHQYFIVRSKEQFLSLINTLKNQIENLNKEL